VDIDRGQFGGCRLQDVTVFMDLHEFAPVGEWAPGRRDGRWLERCAEAREDLNSRGLSHPGLRPLANLRPQAHRSQPRAACRCSLFSCAVTAGLSLWLGANTPGLFQGGRRCRCFRGGGTRSASRSRNSNGARSTMPFAPGHVDFQYRSRCSKLWKEFGTLRSMSEICTKSVDGKPAVLPCEYVGCRSGVEQASEPEPADQTECFTCCRSRS